MDRVRCIRLYPQKKPARCCPECGDDTIMRIAKGDHWEVVCMPVDEPTDDPDLFTTPDKKKHHETRRRYKIKR